MIIKNRSGFVNSLADFSLLMYNKNECKNEEIAGYLYEFCADDKPKVSN
jgi:hypothetical protein